MMKILIIQNPMIPKIVGVKTYWLSQIYQQILYTLQLYYQLAYSQEWRDKFGDGAD